MVFEFDPEKSAANLAKHGIDFEEAQALWDDPRLLDLGHVLYGGEDRRLYVGSWEERCWTAVVTFRGPRVRLISVRRARHSEEAAYHRP